MKKIKHRLIAIAMLLCCITANAQTVQLGGIWYFLDSETMQAQVTSAADELKLKYTGSIVIPSTVVYEEKEYSVNSIGGYAFFCCSDLDSVTIPESVTKIGQGAFEECRNLAFVALPDNLTEIEKYAFAGCSNLSAITIPGHVTWIGEGAFWDCTGLRKISFEDGDDVLCLGANFETPVGESMFYDCPLDTLYLGRDLSYSERELDGYSPFYAKKQLSHVSLSDKVTVLGPNLFFNCSSLDSIAIPMTVNRVDDSAFSYCTNLKEVNINSLKSWLEIDFASPNSNPLYYAKTLYLDGDSVKEVVVPNSITEIKDYAFYNCNGALSSLTIPEGVVCIGDNAFFGCSKLPSIILPKSVTEFGSGVFEGCTGELTVNCDIPAADADLVGVFNKSGFSKVTFGNGVSSIGSYAFSGCSSLAAIAISGTVTEIGDFAFAECVGLKSVNINSLESWLEIDFASPNSNPLYYAKTLYLDGDSVKEVVVPNSITEIKDYAFYNCNGNLSSLTIPEGVVSIGDNAFFGCSKLSSIILPESVTEFGTGVFEGCTGELTVNCDIPAAVVDSVGVFNKSAFSKAILGEKVASIGSYAFFGCSSITSVSVSKNVTEFGVGAFDCCAGELTVNCDIPSASSVSEGAFYNSAFTKLTIGNEVSSIGSYAFANCSKLISVFIPENVAIIGSSAFENCTGELAVNCNIPSASSASEGAFYKSTFTKAVVGDNVESIGDYAFSNCTKLKSISIPENVTFIGNGTFESCTGELTVNCNIPSASSASEGAFYKSNFTKAIIGDKVKQIGSYAFANCGKLTSVTIPESVDSIGNSAFSKCSKLTDIYIDNLESWFAFGYGDKDSHPNVHNEKVNLYIGDDAKLLKKLEIPASITSIPDYAFQNCVALDTVVVAENVKKIGDNAFLGCNGFKSITISQSVDSIGCGAFEGCTGELTVNCNILSASSASEGAFYKSNFTKAVVGDNVESIGDYAFSNCSKLKSISIPESVIMIGCGAFEGCTGELTVNCDIPSASSVSEGAFYKSNFTKAIIGDKVEQVGSYAFANCSKLASVVIPESVDSIGDGAFASCTKLVNVYADNMESWLTIKHGDKESRPNYYSKSEINLYIDNVLLKVVEIPSETTCIPEYAFYGCKNLTSVILPESVDSIGGSAFEGCSALLKVFNYSALPLSEGAEEYGHVAYYAKNLMDMKEVESVDDFQFKTSADGIHYLVNYTGDKKEITLPLAYKSANYQIGDCAFYDCDSLTAVIIAECVDSIGESAFSGCGNLASISLPETMTKIEDNAFKGCSKLTDIRVGSLDSWLTIEYSNKESHPNCNGKMNLYVEGELLRELTIPSTITSIPDYAFYDCDSLSVVTISEDVTELGSYAFAGCNGLDSIACLPPTPPTCGNKAFEGVDMSIPVYVGAATEEYKAAEGWKAFKNIVGDGTADTGVDNVGCTDNTSGTTVVYDLSGRRVDNPTKGIYVINGRKVLIQ